MVPTFWAHSPIPSSWHMHVFLVSVLNYKLCHIPMKYIYASNQEEWPHLITAICLDASETEQEDVGSNWVLLDHISPCSRRKCEYAGNRGEHLGRDCPLYERPRILSKWKVDTRQVAKCPLAPGQTRAWPTPQASESIQQRVEVWSWAPPPCVARSWIGRWSVPVRNAQFTQKTLRYYVTNCERSRSRSRARQTEKISWISMLSSFYRIDYHNQSCVTLANQIYDEASTELRSRELHWPSPVLAMVMGRVHVFWFRHCICRSSQVCSVLMSSYKSWIRSPISFQYYVCFWWIFLDPHMTKHQSHIRGFWLRKSNWIIAAYLTV